MLLFPVLGGDDDGVGGGRRRRKQTCFLLGFRCILSIATEVKEKVWLSGEHHALLLASRRSFLFLVLKDFSRKNDRYHIFPEK